MQKQSETIKQLSLFQDTVPNSFQKNKPIKYKKRNETMVSTSLALTASQIDEVKKEAEKNGTSFVNTIENIINSVPLNNLSCSKKKKKIKLGLSLPKATVETLRIYSKEKNCTMNDLLEKIIKYYFKSKK